MKKLLFTLSLVIFIITSAAAEKWQTYENKSCDYKINYPANAKISSDAKNWPKNFYFIPDAALDQLLRQNPAFKDSRLAPECSVKIDLPFDENTNLDGKYAFVFRIKNAPKAWPPTWQFADHQPGKLITIGKQPFYTLKSSDAGMSKDYTAQYYFQKKNDDYNVIVFLLTAHSFGVKDSDKKEFNAKAESRVFLPMLKSFQ